MGNEESQPTAATDARGGSTQGERSQDASLRSSGPAQQTRQQQQHTLSPADRPSRGRERGEDASELERRRETHGRMVRQSVTTGEQQRRQSNASEQSGSEVEKSWTERRSFRWKIVVVGDVQVGKSALVTRLVHDLFSTKYTPTTDVDFALYNYKDNDMDVELQIWDISGHEREGRRTRVLYSDAVACVVVCDPTQPSTMKGAATWIEDLRTKASLPGSEGRIGLPIVLAVNKMDKLTREQRSGMSNRLTQFAEQYQLLQCWRCSAADDVNVDKTFRSLLNRVKMLAMQCDGFASATTAMEHS